MAIKTTCIGAYPKPDYLRVTNWSETGETGETGEEAREFTYVATAVDSDDMLDRATREAVDGQVRLRH